MKKMTDFLTDLTQKDLEIGSAIEHFCSLGSTAWEKADHTLLTPIRVPKEAFDIIDKLQSKFSNELKSEVVIELFSNLVMSGLALVLALNEASKFPEFEELIDIIHKMKTNTPGRTSSGQQPPGVSKKPNDDGSRTSS